MSFKPYPKYKESGVEWLGRVPEHWEVRRLGFHFDERREKVSDKDYPPLSVTKNGIVPQLETAAKTDDGDNRKLVRAGDFVINSRSDRKGSAGVAEAEGSVSLICTVLSPRPSARPSYVHHLLRSVPFQEEYYRYGKGIVADLWSTNFGDMRNILLAMPPVSEQASIASFLDHETAKIDALIAEQQRLIELLQEKRQAVISHAVTKGLNPDARMKDSGIEWLGEVPEHWEVVRLKNVVRPSNGIQMGPFGGMLKELEQEPTPYKLFGQQNTINDDFEVGQRWLTEHCFNSLREYELVPGDLVLTRKGASIGYCRVVPNGISRGVIDSDTIRVRVLPERISIAFSVALMQEGYLEKEILYRQKGSVLPGLNSSVISNLTVALPPPHEQDAICSHIMVVSEEIDGLCGFAHHSIALLQERRSALISAAVTGQIDVRDFAGGSEAA